MLREHANSLNRVPQPVYGPRNGQKAFGGSAHVDDCLQRPNAVQCVGPCTADPLRPMIEEVKRPWSVASGFPVKMVPQVCPVIRSATVQLIANSAFDC